MTSKFNSFLDLGYITYPPCNEKKYSESVRENFQYYTNQIEGNIDSKANTAFLSSGGAPRHLINLLRDKFSPVRSLILGGYISNSITDLLDDKRRYYITHAKLSFKTPGHNTAWYPHQDNAYKKEEPRTGFAIFVCLEDMSKSNGALALYPKSNKKGLLKHERVIENSSSDSQLFIRNIPSDLEVLEIEARRGSFVVFDQNCIHTSKDTLTSSKRLAIIFEVEEFNGNNLDDYGSVPFLIQGRLSLFEILYLSLKSPFSISRIMLFIRSKPRLRNLLRKLKFLFRGSK